MYRLTVWKVPGENKSSGTNEAVEDPLKIGVRPSFWRRRSRSLVREHVRGEDQWEGGGGISFAWRRITLA